MTSTGGGLSSTFIVLSKAPSTLFLDTNLSLALDSPIRLGWLVCEPRVPTGLLHLNFGVIGASQHLAHTCAGDSNSEPRAFLASTLPTKSWLQAL